MSNQSSNSRGYHKLEYSVVFMFCSKLLALPDTIQWNFSFPICEIQEENITAAIILFLQRTKSVAILTFLPGCVYFPVLGVNA